MVVDDPYFYSRSRYVTDIVFEIVTCFVGHIRWNNRTRGMSLPEFKIPTNQSEWDSHTERFNVETIRCTSKDSRFSIPPKLNIQLFIADPKNTEQVKSWSGIQQFLEVSGYNIEHVQMTEAREVDLLFICTDRDRDVDVEYLVRTISQGLLGLVPKHEILVSGPTRYTNPYGGKSDYPMILTSDFMVYGMCIIHNHIRTLHDNGAKVGRHISVMLQIEAMLQQSGVVQSDKDTVAYGKIREFKELLKSRGHDSGETRWVFATLDLLRHIRNILGHTPPLQKDMDGYEKAASKLNDLATEYGRGFGVPPESNIQDQYSSHKKWVTSLTQVTSHWIIEYLRDNPV